MSLDAYPAKTFWVHHCDGGEAMRSVGEGNRKKEWCWILIKRVEKSSVFDGGGMLEFVVDTFLLKKKSAHAQLFDHDTDVTLPFHNYSVGTKIQRNPQTYYSS
jgi:hypothetical protein